jgi:hypothetical protein
MKTDLIKAKDVFKALWWWPFLFLALFVQMQLGCVSPKKQRNVVEQPTPSIKGVVVDVDMRPNGRGSYRTLQIEFEDGRMFIGEVQRGKALLFKKNCLHVVEYNNFGNIEEVTIVEE